MAFLDRLNATLNRGLAFVASLSLIVMMLITVAEMVFRIFGHPMAGTIETTTWFAAVTTAFALGYTQIHKGHVSIDLVVNRLGPRLRAVVNMLVNLTLSALFMIVTWNIFLYAGVLKKSGSLSETMKVIVYPWVYLVSLGCAGLTLALVADFIRSCMKAFGGRDGKEEPNFSYKPKGDR